MQRSLGLIGLLLVLALFAPLLPAQTQSQPTAQTQKPTPVAPPEGFTDSRGYAIPGTEWAHATPESEHFSAARLEALRAFLQTHQTAAMMVVSRGHVIFSYGDTALVSKVASVRKSILSLLVATEMQKGTKFDLDQTVVQAGLEDKTPFIEPEMHATVEQVFASRSGIYIPNGNSEQDNLTPRRGTKYPGTNFFYNNWDFDAAGIFFEKTTHKDIFDALRDDLAIPLRMQDFDRGRQKKNFIPNSTHFEYATYLSTRDLARLGLLALTKGNWVRTQVADPGFIDWSTYPTTHVDEMHDGLRTFGWTGRWGYGMLWWAWEVPPYPGHVFTGPYQGAFSAMGSGGQFVTVFPLNDLVVVHKVDIDKNEQNNVSLPTYMTILDLVLDAKCPATGCK